MENGSLPKSLHTVRILVAVAREVEHVPAAMPESVYTRMVLRAAHVIGYGEALASDPLIIKAASQLAAQSVRAAA